MYQDSNFNKNSDLYVSPSDTSFPVVSITHLMSILLILSTWRMNDLCTRTKWYGHRCAKDFKVSRTIYS